MSPSGFQVWNDYANIRTKSEHYGQFPLDGPQNDNNNNNNNKLFIMLINVGTIMKVKGMHMFDKLFVIIQIFCLINIIRTDKEYIIYHLEKKSQYKSQTI